MHLLFTNKNSSKVLHIYAKVWTPLGSAQRSENGARRDGNATLVGRLTPCLRLAGSASRGPLSLCGVPSRKSPASGTPFIENHRNIDHLSSDSYWKYCIDRQNNIQIWTWPYAPIFLAVTSPSHLNLDAVQSRGSEFRKRVCFDVFPLFQMRKLGLWEFKWSLQSHIASHWIGACELRSHDPFSTSPHCVPSLSVSHFRDVLCAS